MKKIKKQLKTKKNKKMKKNHQKNPGGNNSVPLKQFPGYTIILGSGEIIVYPHTNQYPTLLTL